MSRGEAGSALPSATPTFFTVNPGIPARASERVTGCRYWPSSVDRINRFDESEPMSAERASMLVRAVPAWVMSEAVSLISADGLEGVLEVSWTLLVVGGGVH